MYKISIPMMNDSLNDWSREEYLKQLRAAHVERVFLIPNIDARYGIIDDGLIESLRGNLAWLEQNGIEGALWVGNTLGHGGLMHEIPRMHGSDSFTPLVNFAGEEMSGTACPLNLILQRNVVAVFRKLATVGAKMILIDDDFRLSEHSNGMTLSTEFCCLCDLHMKKIKSVLGESITREELRAKAFVGKPNKYREAFLQAQGDSLRELAKLLRAAVDEVDPGIGLAICTCYCHWGVDGVTPLELTEIFQGKHEPLMRLHGAPYWATRRRNTKSLPFVFEIGRMFAALCRGRGIELMDEGDCYPRPRDYTPASYIELHDAVMRANGTSQGNLKYMFDYVASPEYETGYIDHHVHDLPTLRQIENIFSEGEQVGVHIQIDPDLIRKIDCNLTPAIDHCLLPRAGAMLAMCGIPTTYEDEGMCRAVFGEHLYSMPDDAIDGGLILDAVSALLLTERGVDVGMVADEALRSFEEGSVGTIANFSPIKTVCERGQERAPVRNGKGSFFSGHLCASVMPVLYGIVNGKERPIAYRYENAKGQRFLVFTFNAEMLEKNSDIYHGYMMQSTLHGGVEWVSRKRLPAVCVGNPYLYMICKKKKDTLSIVLFNCFADSILSPEIQLDEAYEEIEFVNTAGTLDGSTVRLQALGAFSFAAFCVKKKK